MPKVSKTNLLVQPYRDRQVIVVLKTAESDAAPMPVRLRDYYSGDVHEANATLKNWLRLDHWTNSKTWGVYGFMFDRLRGKTSTGGTKEVDHFVRISADVAERIIQFRLLYLDRLSCYSGRETDARGEENVVADTGTSWFASNLPKQLPLTT